VGGDPIHAGLGTEAEKRKNIGATGSEVWSYFKQGEAEEHVKVQHYVGGTREFSTEFDETCIRSLFLEPLAVGAFAVFW